MNRFICYGLLLFSFPVLADHGYQNHENYFDNYPSNDTRISNASYDADTGIFDFSHATGSDTWNIIWAPYNSTGDSYNYSFEMRTYGDTGSFTSGQRLIRMDAGKRQGNGTCGYDDPYRCSWSNRFWNDGVVDVSSTLDYSGTGYSDWTLYSGSHDISGWNDSGLAWAYWHVSGLTGDGTNGPQIRNFYGCVDCTLPGLIDDGTTELFTYTNDGVCDYTAIEDPDCTNEVYVEEPYETASNDGQDNGSSSNDGQDNGSSGHEEETYYEPEPETSTDTGNGQEESYQDDGSTGETGEEEPYEEYSNDQVVQEENNSGEADQSNINPDEPLANDMDIVKNSIAGSFRRTVNSRSTEFLQSIGAINNISGGPDGYNSQGSNGSSSQGSNSGSNGSGNMMMAQNDPVGWNINQIIMNQGLMESTEEEEEIDDNPLGSDELEEELSIKDLGGLSINSIKQPNLVDNNNWYSDRNILEQSGIYNDQKFYKQKEMYNEVEWYGN